MPSGKPASSATRERRASRARPCTTATQKLASGPNSGPEHHRSDDQDRRVEEDPDRRDQRRQRHEHEEARRQLGGLGGELLHLFPHDRVRGIARGRALGAFGGAREIDRRRPLDRDRPVLGNAQLLEIGAARCSRPRARHHTAPRPPRAAAPRRAGARCCDTAASRSRVSSTRLTSSAGTTMRRWTTAAQRYERDRRAALIGTGF